MRERFVREGLDHFEYHEILELILYYAVPRRDTNLLAHRLLSRFDGSFSHVLDAPLEELTQVEGVGKNAAVLIKMFPEVCRRYLMELSEVGTVVKNSEEAARCLCPLFIGRTAEMVALMCLDGKGKVVYCGTAFEGSVNAAAVSVRRIVELAVRYATSNVIMAHNHPRGVAVPSEEDIRVTERVASALRMVDVTLLDHIIVADNDWVSLALTPSMADVFPRRPGFRGA